MSSPKHIQYNNEINDLDCISEVLALCGDITVTDYPLKEITRRFNAALDRYFSLAFQYGLRERFDDINETTPPIDTQNIVSGTNRYKISAFSETIINILRVEILDENDNGLSLEQEYFRDLDHDAFQEWYIDADTGVPTHYLILGGFIYLRGNPGYAKTDGLKIYFNRPASYMAYDDTTKVPGIPVIHHTYLCRMAALPWLIQKKLPQRGEIAQLIQQDEMAIKEYFGNLDNDNEGRITTRPISHR